MNETSDITQQPPAPAPPTFEIDSAERANWLVRRLVECQSYRTRVRAFAERERRRADREERELIRRFGSQLEAWVRRELARQGGRRRSVAFPAGVAGYRRRGPTLVIEDQAAVLRWAREHLPGAVVVKERLLQSRLKEAMEATGLIPDDGVRVEPARDRFFVR